MFFFIKNLTQQKKNALIVHFRNLGVQKFLQTLNPHSGTLKKKWKSWKKQKKAKKSKKWDIAKKQN